MISSIFMVIGPILVLMVLCSYYCTTTFEYRSYNYFLTFNNEEFDFGNVTTGNTYHAYHCAYYRKWKRHEMYHYFDDNNVNCYLDMNDDFKKQYYTVKTNKPKGESDVVSNSTS